MKEPTPLKEIIPPKEYRDMTWWAIGCISYLAIVGASVGELCGRHDGQAYIGGIFGLMIGGWIGAHFGSIPWIEWEKHRNERDR